jgi:hypothetical protein
MKNFKILIFKLYCNQNSESGSALIIAVIISIFTFALGLMYYNFSESIQQFSEADTRNFNAFHTAQGALADRNERVISSLVANPNALKNTTLQADTPFSCLSGLTTNSAASACEDFRPKSKKQVIKGSASEITDATIQELYYGYTVVTDRTDYQDFATDRVNWTRLSAADVFAGAISKPYLYTIGSLGIKQDSNGNTRGQAILEANASVRRLPVFQFDRLSFGDDTIVLKDLGAAQTLSGRYHANGDLKLINNNANPLVLGGHWTIGGQLDANTGTNYVTLPGGFSLIPNASSVPYADLYNYTGVITAASTGMRRLIMPSNELLKPFDSSGNLQSLYGNADIRITRRDVPIPGSPTGTIPFTLTAIQSGSTILTGACTDLSPDRENLASTKCQTFSKGMLVSLLQPILVNNRGDVAEEAKYCKNQPTPEPAMLGYSPAIQDKILRAVQIVLSTNQANIFNLSYIDTIKPNDPAIDGTGNTISILYQQFTQADIITLLTAIPGINAVDIPVIGRSNIQSLAAARKSCFLAAPIQIPRKATSTYYTSKKAFSGSFRSFYDRREQKYIAPLQVNMQSLAIWNRDGVYGEFPSNNLDLQEEISATDLLILLNSSATTDGYLWSRTPADPSKPGSLVESGLGAKSLIIHNTNEATNQEPFIYNGGSNLPAPTSIVSDRAIYVQGDWNSTHKQPAAIMADSLTMLSNNCLATIDNYYIEPGKLVPNGMVNCGVTSDMNLADNTNFNAAILSAVNPISGSNIDSSPIRYLEDWTGKILTGQTSFVINGIPVHSTSSFVAPGTGAYGATEYFRYPSNVNFSLDLGFTEPNGLPPGTPMAIDVMTGSIDRKYKEGERENIQKIRG